MGPVRPSIHIHTCLVDEQDDGLVGRHEREGGAAAQQRGLDRRCCRLLVGGGHMTSRMRVGVDAMLLINHSQYT